MADLFVCRATYKAKTEKGVGLRSKIYAFATTGFSTAESLAYATVRRESDYAAAAKVTSIKRKNLGVLDDYNVESGEYLYRATVRNLLHVESNTYVSISFVFPAAVSPVGGLDVQQLTSIVETRVSNKGYAFEKNDPDKLTDVNFSCELLKRRLSASDVTDGSESNDEK